jgi:CBS domain-containing protein
VASERGAEVGLVSDLALLRAVGEGRYDATAAELAMPAPLRVRLDDDVAAAARLMSEHGVQHVLVVVPGSDRVVGIMSSLDVAEVVAQPP